MEVDPAYVTNPRTASIVVLWIWNGMAMGDMYATLHCRCLRYWTANSRASSLILKATRTSWLPTSLSGQLELERWFLTIKSTAYLAYQENYCSASQIYLKVMMGEACCSPGCNYQFCNIMHSTYVALLMQKYFWSLKDWKLKDVLPGETRWLSDHNVSWLVAPLFFYKQSFVQVATPDQAQEAHAFIRKWLSDNVSSQAASDIRILYGQSPLLIFQLNLSCSLHSKYIANTSLNGMGWLKTIYMPYLRLPQAWNEEFYVPRLSQVVNHQSGQVLYADASQVWNA